MLVRARAHCSKTDYEHMKGWVQSVGLALVPCVAEPQVKGDRALMEKRNKDGVHYSVTEI